MPIFFLVLSSIFGSRLFCQFEKLKKNKTDLVEAKIKRFALIIIHSSKMIQFVVLQNRQGKTRLSKWYIPMEESQKRTIEGEVHR